MREFEPLRGKADDTDDENEEERDACGGRGSHHDQTAENANEDEEDLDVPLLQRGELAGDEVEGEGKTAGGVQKEEDWMMGDGIQKKGIEAVMEEKVNSGEEKKGIDGFGEPLNTDNAIQQLVQEIVEEKKRREQHSSEVVEGLGCAQSRE